MNAQPVLIVDDDADATFLLGAHLERLQIEVHAAHSLAEATQALASLSPVVILCDRYLGDGDGLTLFANGRPNGVRLALLLSGEEISPNQLRQAKFDGQHRKPIDPHAIGEAVRGALSTR
jgi:DNA-binding NtrC family response regulator